MDIFGGEGEEGEVEIDGYMVGLGCPSWFSLAIKTYIYRPKCIYIYKVKHQTCTKVVRFQITIVHFVSL